MSRLYGARCTQVTAEAKDDLSLLAPLSNTSSDTGAAVVHAVRSEMALTLSDVVFRRTALGGLGHPGRAALDRAAALMARELRWSAEETARQIAQTEALFPMGPL